MLNESVCIIWAAFEETALSIKHPMHAAATSAVPTRDMVIFPPLSPIRSRPANNKLITFHYSWHPGARRYEKRSGRTKNAIICRWPSVPSRTAGAPQRCSTRSPRRARSASEG